jgi:hypothetical protein
MLGEAIRYPVADGTARDAVAVCTGLVVVALLLLRAGSALWPGLLAVVPLALVVVPASAFLGYLGRVLRPDPAGGTTQAFDWSTATVRLGGRLLLLATVYLLPAVVAVLGAAFVLLEGSGTGGALLTMVPTVALLVTVAALYVLPAALAAGVDGGLRAGLSRASLGGLASGSYFFAWTVSTVLVVLGWSVVTAARTATIGTLVGAVVFAYGHVAAARLLSEGLSRSRWTPPDA